MVKNPIRQILFIFILILANFFSYAQKTKAVSGIVFNDLNNNRILDNNESGIENVSVSNQLEVVKTDYDGKYSLPITENTIIFITKPSGYKVPLNENNIPQYFYIHQPNGSSEGLDYKGIEPTGPLSKSLNFPLIKTETKNEFNVIVSGDPQPYKSEQVDYYLNDVVTEMMDYESDFYIALGDLVEDDLSLYDKLNEGVRHLEIPAYNVIGNHDINLKSEDNNFKAETYKSIFGPDYYSFDYGKVHFVVLNSIQYEGWNSEKNKQGKYYGGFDDKQLQWLENDIKLVPEDKLVVVVTHMPILDRPMDKETIQKVFRKLKKRKHLFALAGHQHKIRNNSYDKESYWNGKADFPYLVAGAACGSWWSKVKDERGIPLSVAQDGTPNGFFVFNFNDNEYSFKFHPANHNPNYQMRISAPAIQFSKDSLEKEQVIVNVFAGNPNHNVEFQLDDNPPVKMNHQNMIDPLMVPYFDAFKEFDEWKVKPSESMHMWVAKLPADLKVGSHKLKITTTDMFGNEFTAHRIFEVTN